MRSLARRSVAPLASAAITFSITLSIACSAADQAAGPPGAPTQLLAAGVTAVTGRAGQAASESLSVVVRNAAGVMANATVNFTVMTGGGTLSAASVATSALGVAKVRWTLGGAVGAQTVRASVDTVTPLTFTAAVTAGPTLTLTVVAGNAQVAAANTLLPVSPRVRATDVFGNNVAGETITFASTGGTNVLAGVTQVTDINGLATLGSWTLGPCAGAAQVTASASTPATVTFGATATGGGTYCIELLYTSTPDPVLRAAAERAAAKWSRVLVSDFPIETVTIGSGLCAGIVLPGETRSIKALVIYVQLAPIASSTPGLVTLGSASACYIRDSNGLTQVGGMRLNSDYLLTNLSTVQMEDVVLHEMGHVLGFGILWRGVTAIPALPIVLQNPAPAGIPTFIGANAVSSYIAVGGPPGSVSVPVEACGGAGTINSHWTETFFGDELMTGFISAPAGQHNVFSQVTISAMKDIGYSVDMTQATAYTLAGKPCPALLEVAPHPGAIKIGSTWVIEELGSPTHVVRNGRPEPIVRR